MPGRQRPLADGESEIKQQLTVAKEQTALSKFVKEFKSKWQRRPNAAWLRGRRLQGLQSAQELQVATSRTGCAEDRLMRAGAPSDGSECVADASRVPGAR